MLNKASLVGRLTKDVELRYLGNGTPVANFTLAVNRPFKNRQGENEADFLNIVVWRKQAENCAQYIGKGSLVAVAGRIQSRSYDNAEGQRRYITEIVADEVHFLEPKSKSRNYNQGDSPESDQKDVSLEPGLYPIDEDETDLPF